MLPINLNRKLCSIERLFVSSLNKPRLSLAQTAIYILQTLQKMMLSWTGKMILSLQKFRRVSIKLSQSWRLGMYHPKL